MFETALGVSAGRTRRPWTVLTSFFIQLLVIGLGVLTPLVYTDVLPRAERFIGLAPPPSDGSEPKTHEQTRPTVKTKPRPFSDARLHEPGNIPDKVELVDDRDLPPSEPGGPQGFSIPGATGNGSDVLSPALRQALESARAASVAPPPRVEKARQPEEKIRYRVGGLVQPPRPVSTPRPVYPPLARQARISGAVRLEAVIGTDGSVRGLRVLQGHPMLVHAAIEAVRQWMYTPPTLNGDPIEVVMIVDVTFTLQ